MHLQDPGVYAPFSTLVYEIIGPGFSCFSCVHVQCGVVLKSRK